MSATFRGLHIESVHFVRKTEICQLIDQEGQVVAELKRREFLSQPQLKSLRHTNGRHRPANSAFYGSPAGQSGGAWVSGAFLRTGGVAFFGADYAAPVENAGIRAGEVIADRGWRVECGELCSIYMRRRSWPTDSPMRGDVRHEYGVHAFKTTADVLHYIHETRLWQGLNFVWLADRIALRDDPNPIFAYGKVALWGEVVEHERGYRAEFAKVSSIDGLVGDAPNGTLQYLRDRYCGPMPEAFRSPEVCTRTSND